MITDIILGIILPFVLLLAAGYLLLTRRNDEVIKWVDIAVRAAEQIFKESGMGKEKFNYVVDWISDKFKISKADLKNLIESAVFQMNNENHSKNSSKFDK